MINIKQLFKMKKIAKTNSAGFTLIELLVVIAIIGVLAGVITLAANDARSKGRDAKRVGDLKQMGNAMEQYHIQNGVYPTGTVSIDSAGNGGDLLSDPGALDGGGEPFIPNYTAFLPSAPEPADSPCTNSAGAGNNNYWYQVADDGITYTLTACIGHQTGDLAPGPHTLTPEGMQ
jgi:prepilin-type N-terminal cleavage/methylation domain-containing protein